MDESPGNEVEQFYSLTVSHSLSKGRSMAVKLIKITI